MNESVLTKKKDDVEEQERKQFEKMTKTPIPRLVVSLGIPTMLNMMVTSIYNLADTYFVSGLGDRATGAVNVVLSLMSIIQAIGFTLGMGAGSIVSRLLGQRKQKEADTVATSAFFASLLFGLIISVFGLIFLNELMWALGATVETDGGKTTLDFAREYSIYILLAAPFMCMSFVLNNLLRAQGKALLSMIGLVTGALVNVALDPILIYIADMGMTGAAVATCASQTLSFGILLFIFLSGKTIARLRLSCISKSLSVYFDVLATGFPSFCRQILASLCTVLLNWAVKPYDGALPALGVVQKVFMFAFSISLGIGQGYQPVLGYNYSAKRFGRVRSAYLFTLGFSTAIMTVFAIVCAIFAPNIMGAFLESERSIEIGVLSLRLQCICMPLLPLNFMAGVTYQAVGSRLGAAVLSVSRQGLFYIPAVLVLPKIWNLFGVQCCQSVSDFCAMLFCLPFTFSFFRSLKKLEGETPKDSPNEPPNEKVMNELLNEKSDSLRENLTDVRETEDGVNVYDFDDTIFDGDTERYFWKFILKKYPNWKWNTFRLKLFWRLEERGLVRMKFSRRQIYKFLKKIPNIEEVVEDFWNEHEKYVKNWYLEERKDTDIISSATPYFLLTPLFKRFGFGRLIATDMDEKTGQVRGEWNSGAQKVVNFKRLYPELTINRFYSDSEKDLPLAQISKKAFKVDGNERKEWF